MSPTCTSTEGAEIFKNRSCHASVVITTVFFTEDACHNIWHAKVTECMRPYEFVIQISMSQLLSCLIKCTMVL